MDLKTVLSAYLVIINLISFFVYGIDKRKAQAGAWRIPESTLILLAAAGGGAGAFLGMRVFHHKTKKPIFQMLVPIFLIIWLMIAYWSFMTS